MTFWSGTPMSEEQNRLLNAVFAAHSQSVFRDNCSSQALLQAATGSGNLPNALIAALSTLGGRHAPLVETHRFLSLDSPEERVADMLARKQRIPGWGNSFHKGNDPLWSKVDFLLRNEHPEMYRKIRDVTETLHSFGKAIYPNPSAFTAATAILTGMRAELAAYLFIAGRLLSWHELFLRTLE